MATLAQALLEPARELEVEAARALARESEPALVWEPGPVAQESVSAQALAPIRPGPLHTHFACSTTRLAQKSSCLRCS